MTPKEKAEKLINNFIDIENAFKEYTDYVQAKQCALICVDEILKANPSKTGLMTGFKRNKNYWQQVKTEIEKL